MLSFPLITRELRVQSRKRSTYSMRLGWGLAAVALLLFYALTFPNQSANGRTFLSMVHLWLAVMLFVLAPIGAADAISRERREGTLGLLLLTRLTPIQVVLGKLATHLIRVGYFALMMVPFLVIPVLLGGVGLQDFITAAVMLFTVAVLGIACGLLASTIFVSFGAALCWGLILSALLLTLVSTFVLNTAMELLPNTFPSQIPASFRLFLGPGLLVLPLNGRDVAGMFFASRWFLPAIEAGLVLLSLLFLLFAILFAACRIAAHLELAVETRRQAAFRKQFLTPIIWRKAYRKVMSRSLDRNPFAWLEYRTAWARAARWALILIVILVETGLLMTVPERNEFIRLHFWMACLVVAFLTLKSSSSFQREKENGAFELILVTPITEAKLILGRLLAVAAYYAPIVLILLALGLYGLAWSEPWIYRADAFELSSAARFLSICGSILSAPVCGLFFALRCRTFPGALLWTAGLAIVAPLCLWTAFDGLTWYASARWVWSPLLSHALNDPPWWPVLLVVALYHITLGARCARATLDLLRRREFAASS